MSLITHRYEKVRFSITKAGHCPVCGRSVRRSRTFWHTVNPFNRNADGTVKTRAEIWRALLIEADEWTPDFTHERCAS